MSSNSQKDLLQAIERVFDILGIVIENEAYLQELVEQIGWDLNEVAGFSVNQLSQHLQVFTVDFKQFAIDLEENPPQTLEGFARALENVKKLFDDIRSLNIVFNNLDFNTPQLEEFSKDLIEYLAISYIRIRYSILYRFAILLTLIQDGDEMPLSEPIFDDQGVLVRFPHRRSQLRFDRFDDLLKDPESLLKQEYFSLNELHTQADAIRASHKLFPRLDALLSELGFSTVFSYNPAYGIDFGEVGNQLAAGMLTIFLESDIEELEFGVTLAFSSTEHGDLGLVVIPFGNLELSQRFSNWQLYSELTAGVQAFAIGPQGLTILAEPDTIAAEAGFNLIKIPDSDDESAFLIGSTKGTRFEIGQFLFSGKVSLSEKEVEVDLLTEAYSAALVIASGDGDGFLQKILPAEGVRADFDLAIGWSNKKGLYFRGSAGLDATLPIQLSLFGVLTIDSIYLAIKTDGGGIENTVAASLRAKIGPIEAILDRVGLEAKIIAPEEGGNLGLLNLDFGFKSPTSIGLSINAEGVTGGGFLKIDPPNYAGMMQLSFRNEIELTAFGLITTKLPDGTDGFSMVIQIMAEFQPIQLGLGFALTGVGGLIGINRQINEEALTEAFKNHSLDTFLFPENPIKDAVKIIDSIQGIMPPREGYHVIGPMVQMFWGGSVRLVEFEVGIFIQTGGPLKVVLIGQARTQLPEGKSPRLVINMDVLGIIDYGEERIAIDAVLFDSRILNYALDGKMALRSDWSSGEESFALSVGGFHPEFQNIPAGFPQLTRLMVTIGSGNPRLTLQMYLAITPNTLQIGAKFELWAKKSGFTITGGASFDALFTFSPLSFLVIINIWANIKRGRFDLGVDLELELSGPNPMIAIGYAKFKIGWFSKKVRFRKQFGDQTPDPLPVVSPLAALLTALEHKRSIRFELPVWASASLVFAQTAESRIDPVADILISQSTVPLNFNMRRFGGGNPPPSEQKLSITAGFEPDKEKITKTLFAPEQFKNWSTEERLAAKAFENYDAGIRFTGDYIIPEDAIEERNIGFETVLRESRSYRHKLTKDDVRRERIRTTCVRQATAAEAQYFANWTLFGSNNYFKPLRKVRDKNHVYSIKVLEPGYVLTDTYQQEGSSPTPVIESQKQHAMSYAEALDAFKDSRNPHVVIRSATDAIVQ